MKRFLIVLIAFTFFTGCASSQAERAERDRKMHLQTKEAAERGDLKAQFGLGIMYLHGYSPAEMSYTKAFHWLSKAAESGYPPAQYQLGIMYEMGKGVDQSDTDAIYWYEKAARQGESSAKGRLERLVRVTKEPPGRPRTPVEPTTPMPPAGTITGFGTYHALVIGINDYSAMPKLETAIGDAKAVAELLTQKYDFRVGLLVNATRSDVFKALSEFRMSLNATDNLLIYFAGHGVFDRETARGYWLPVNAKENNKAKWIPNEDITSELKAIKAKHILIVADSCYSGTFTRSPTRGAMRAGGLEEWVRRMAHRRSRTVLTSGGLEPVQDYGGAGHSVFAQAFLQTLLENTSIIDTDSLYHSIKRRVVVNAKQTPIYSDIRFSGHDNGDFIFVPR